MSTITQTDQSQVDQLAREYVQLHGMKIALKLARERGDRLQKAIMTAHMWLSMHQTDRALQTLSQALTS